MVRTRHVVLAVVLHVIVLGLLFVGFRFVRKVTPPPPIQATIIDTKSTAPAPPAPAAPPKVDVEKLRQEQKRLEDEKKAREVEQQKKAEQLDQQRKVEEEKKNELVRKQALEQAKRQKEDEARKQREDEARRQKEDAARREAERKKQEQKEREEQLLAGIQSEEKLRKSAATASAQAAWIRAIIERVQPRFNPPPGAPDDFQCRVHVSLLPGGQIVDVKLMESCGNPMLDDSVERAIRKSDPLPLPQDPAAFDRDLEFTFVPRS